MSRIGQPFIRGMISNLSFSAIQERTPQASPQLTNRRFQSVISIYTSSFSRMRTAMAKNSLLTTFRHSRKNANATAGLQAFPGALAGP